MSARFTTALASHSNFYFLSPSLFRIFMLWRLCSLYIKSRVRRALSLSACFISLFLLYVTHSASFATFSRVSHVPFLSRGLVLNGPFTFQLSYLRFPLPFVPELSAAEIFCCFLRGFPDIFIYLTFLLGSSLSPSFPFPCFFSFVLNSCTGEVSWVPPHTPVPPPPAVCYLPPDIKATTGDSATCKCHFPGEELRPWQSRDGSQDITKTDSSMGDGMLKMSQKLGFFFIKRKDREM